MLSNAESMLCPPLSCSAQRQILAAASALPVSQRLRISDESKGTKCTMRQGTQMRSRRRLHRTQRKKKLKSEKKIDLREFKLQFELEIYCQAQVPKSPEGQSEGIMTNQRV